jgi:hypothetical protein
MIKPDLNWFYDQIKDAQLAQVEDGKLVKTFRLRKYPDRSMMSCWIFFTPAGIVITGDMRPADQGVIALGYGLEWFAEKLEPDYLASKFLKEKWVPDAAFESWDQCMAAWEEKAEEYEKECEEEFGTDPWPDPGEEFLRLKDWRSGKERTELHGVTFLKALRHLLDNRENFESAQTLYESLPAFRDESEGRWICPFSSEDLGGYGYQPAEFGWLAAIQRRFSECYKANSIKDQTNA